ncbi:MAG: PilZ domain-containing protein, partial [Candidatus Hermodarchaeota archaeon]
MIPRENRMKIDKVRRLSVRVPAIGWEVLIATESSERIKARIGNISADGAYLITKEQYQPNSKIILSIKSSLIRFSSTALVVRNDPYGIAVRFLNHTEATRRS